MITILVITLLVGQLLAQQHPWDPQYRNEDYFKNWHEQLMNQTKLHGKEVQIVFLGDSITQGWRYSGAPIWDKYYAPRHAFNYGVGGDKTENILWRLANKEFDGVNPKVVVLMIGTNNLGSNTIEDIAHGVQEILHQLAVKMPMSKVILLGVLPRDEPLGTKGKQLNVLLKKLADEKTVHWLDMWSEYTTPEGKQRYELYLPDHLHMDAGGHGYEVWQKTMEPLLKKIVP